MAENIILGIIIGIISYVTLYMGKGVQKYAIEGFKDEETGKSKNSGIWIFGTMLTGIPVLVQIVALNFAPVNIVAPLEGVGLIALLIFSYYVLKESITKNEIAGVICVLIGTVMTTLFITETAEQTVANFNQNLLFILLTILVITELLLIVISKLNSYKLGGVILGLTAGTMMAFQTVTKRISLIIDLQPEFSIAFLIVSIVVFAPLTLVFTQYGFAITKANRVIPYFTSASILLATLIGFLVLNENIHPMQIVGIIIIVFGVIFLTAFQKESGEATNLTEIIAE